MCQFCICLLFKFVELKFLKLVCCFVALTSDEQQRRRCDRLHRRRSSEVSHGGMSVRKLHHRRHGRGNEGRHRRHQQRSHQRVIPQRLDVLKLDFSFVKIILWSS